MNTTSIVACRHSVWCKALRTCRPGFPIATRWCCDQGVKVMPGATFTKTACDQCGSLQKGGNAFATFQLALR